MLLVLLVALAVPACGEGEPTHLGKPVSEWAAGLTALDEDARNQTFALLQREGARAVPLLTALLTHENALTRHAALKFLRHTSFSSMDGAEVAAFLPALRAALTLDDVEAQLFAVGVMASAGPPAADGLTQALDSPHALVRVRAAEFLSRCGAAAVPGLIRALEDEEPPVRAAAHGSVLILGPEAAGAAPALEGWLASDDCGTRCLGALALARVDPASERALSELTALLAEESPGVRDTAVEGLVLLGERARPALERSLAEEDPTVRVASALALGRIASGHGTALATLGELLGHEDDDVALAAAAALEKLGEPAVPVLVAALESGGIPTRRLAALTLGGMGPAAARAVGDLRRAMEHEDAGLRVRAAFAVWKLTHDAAVVAPVLVRALDSDEANRRKAVEILWEIGAEAASVVPDLLDLAINGKREVRPTAVLLLGRMGAAASSVRGPLWELRSVESDPVLLKALDTALRKIPR